MSSIKEAKTKLQNALLDLIVKFEEEYDVSVNRVDMQKVRNLGTSTDRTVFVLVQTEF